MADSLELELVSVKPGGNTEIVLVDNQTETGTRKGLENSPAVVYLATLRPSGRRTMLQKLNEIAEIVRPQASQEIKTSSGEDMASTKKGKLKEVQNIAFTFPWHELRYQHTVRYRAMM